MFKYSRLNIMGINVGFFDNIQISTNFSIADVREPNSRNASFSKTIKIPGTKEVNILFESAYNVNIDFQSFDPNVKMLASYYSSEWVQFSGYLQLLDIIVSDNSLPVYECSLIGVEGDLFLNIGDKYLSDLAVPGIGYNIPSTSDWGFTDLNHVFNYANFSAVPTPGTGYCYPYQDYGMNGMNGFNWRIEFMKAGIFELEYVRRIFIAAGKTFTSTTLASSYYKHIYIPDINERGYQFSPAQIVDNQFYANKTSTQTVTGPVTISAPNDYLFDSFGIAAIIFQNETTIPFNDPGSVYNNATGIFTVGIASTNIISAIVNYTIKINTLVGATTFTTNFTAIALSVKKNGVIVMTQSQNLGVQTVAISGGFATIATSFTITYPSTGDVPGDTYQIAINDLAGAQTYVSGFFSNGGGPMAAIIGPVMSTIVDVNSTFASVLANTDLKIGGSIDMNTTIPPLIKQIDFIISIFKAENIYIEQDKLDKNNYIVESREQFIDYTNPIDWTDKHDISKDTIVSPMGALDARSYTLTYAEDQDFYNKKYKDKWKEVYGQSLTKTNTDFVKTDKIIDVIFSATPGVAFQSTIVAPRFLQIDGAAPGTGGSSTTKGLKCNIRRLYWGGTKSCSPHNLKTGNGSDIPNPANWLMNVTSYPYGGHLDDPTAPTVDLNFGEAKELYFNLPGQILTTANRFGVRYSKFISEITDKNSKIVVAHMLLDERDIKEFTFRKIIYFKHAYFFVNKISDYDPQVRQSIPVEFLKLKRGADFTPQQYLPSAPPAGTGRTAQTNPLYNNENNYGQTGNAVIGRNNNNGVGTGLLTGEGTQTDRAINQFDGIGVNDLLIGPEYEGQVMLRADAFRVSDGGMEKIKMSRDAVCVNSFTVSKPVSYVDSSAGNVDVTLPDATLLVDITIVVINLGGNVVTVRGFLGTELIKSGGTSATTDTPGSAITRNYKTDGSNWYY